MDKRLQQRVPVGPQFRVRFQLGGHPYTNISVSNLGPDGCCIEIPAQSVSGLRTRALLEGWKFVNPAMPRGAIKAKVVWVRGQDSPGKDSVESGIKFVDAPMEFTRRLASYVRAVTPPPVS
jgi:PilZ domain